MANLLLRLLGAASLNAAPTRHPYEHDSLRPKTVPTTGVTLSMDNHADIHLLELLPGNSEAAIFCKNASISPSSLITGVTSETSRPLSHTWAVPSRAIEWCVVGGR
jgi:hypothetical protein